jgi:hypothetical protein
METSNCLICFVFPFPFRRFEIQDEQSEKDETNEPQEDPDETLEEDL